MNQDNIAIVLTGTIIPTNPVVISDPKIRKNQYLEAIHYYCQFAPVFFLENSSYDLMSDQDFNKIPNLFIRKFPPSLFFERGKGYQEFEMIDNWIKTENNLPKYWIKITGRYIYLNFNELYKDCLQEDFYHMIVDKNRIFKLAHTCIFYVATEFYKTSLMGIYLQCDDRINMGVETIFYNKLSSFPNHVSRIFSCEPKLVGFCATNGQEYGGNSQIYHIRSVIRKFTYMLDKNYVWHSRYQL